MSTRGALPASPRHTHDTRNCVMLRLASKSHRARVSAAVSRISVSNPFLSSSSPREWERWVRSSPSRTMRSPAGKVPVQQSGPPRQRVYKRVVVDRPSVTLASRVTCSLEAHDALECITVHSYGVPSGSTFRLRAGPLPTPSPSWN